HSSEVSRRWDTSACVTTRSGTHVATPVIAARGRPLRSGSGMPESAVIFDPMPPLTRRRTTTVQVGGVSIGSAHPIVIQSMTNTDTADVAGGGGGGGAAPR